MNKRTIWILIILMIIAFGALVFIQSRYLKTTSNMAEERFDDAVKGGMLQAVTLLEENEALQYLAQTLDENDYHYSAKSRKPVTGNNDYELAKPGGVKLSTKHGKATIEETSKYLQEKFQKNFSRSKTILDQAVFRWLRDKESKDITERVDFVELDEILGTIFKNNNIDLPFYYSVTDKKGRVIYQCGKTIMTQGKPNTDIYTQELFPNEEKHEVFLNVVFPTKQDSIRESLNLLFPSVVSILLTLAIFIYAIFIIFRQKQLNNMKNDFVNNMTHEFKTPISTISLASQMLQDPSVGKSPETLKHISNVVRDETKRLSLQVEKVLQMSMFDRDQTSLKLTEIHINDLIKDIIGNFSLKVTSKGGKIISELKAPNDLGYIDEIHFTNVIFNLMDNALKYCDKTPILTLETWNEKENILISVEDNGIGIKKDDLKKIFEKFYRVSTGNLHNVKGFGLGLAYVKKIVEQHHGAIKAESELEVGTKFIITIPTLKKF